MRNKAKVLTANFSPEVYLSTLSGMKNQEFENMVFKYMKNNELFYDMIFIEEKR